MIYLAIAVLCIAAGVALRIFYRLSRDPNFWAELAEAFALLLSIFLIMAAVVAVAWATDTVVRALQ